MFRKLALLGLSDGPNLYIDSDTVILRQLLPFADAWSESGADLAVADADVPQAFHPGPLAQRTLGFNAGFFIARAGLTDLSNLQTLATDALRVVDQFVIENVDQPFFNFVCDEAGWDVRTITQLVPGTPYCTWSERAIDPVQPWIHWAGRSLAYDMSHRELWVRWRLEGAAPAEKARFRLGETRCGTWLPGAQREEAILGPHPAGDEGIGCGSRPRRRTDVCFAPSGPLSWSGRTSVRPAADVSGGNGRPARGVGGAG
jgi:hypothetical protein